MVLNTNVANPTCKDVVLHSGLNCGLAEPCDETFIAYSTHVNGKRTEKASSDRHVSFDAQPVDGHKVKEMNQADLGETAEAALITILNNVMLTVRNKFCTY